MVDNITFSNTQRTTLNQYNNNSIPQPFSSNQHHENINYNNNHNFYNQSILNNEDHEEQGIGLIKEQDRLLPIANVGRIMKQILPPNAKISKEAKETMQECVSEFISFVTGEASDKCHKEKRKTVNGDDICWALASLGFDDYSEPLKRYLHRHREFEGERLATQSSKERDLDHGN
ncbi:nuclear transcription factor Y subunit B-5-like [Silene latifolia]|uniref:nuclear transcription factor Y subunit B-5-like n=1 Tax=Silene latifolia TaxID=37657 RepID=UPI003D778015